MRLSSGDHAGRASARTRHRKWLRSGLAAVLSMATLAALAAPASATDTMPWGGQYADTSHPEQSAGANQPYQHGYTGLDILNWNPDADKDSEYLRSRVPLQTRIAANAATLGVPHEQVSLGHVGLNHLTWERSVTVDGVDQAAPAPRFSRTPSGPVGAPPQQTTPKQEMPKATDDALQKLLSQLNKTQTPASNPLGTGGGLGGGNPLGNSGLGGNQGGGTPLSQTKPQTTSDEPKKLVEDKKLRKKVFDAIAADQFYIFSHPKALGNLQSRMESILRIENPADPFLERPEVGAQLKAALRAG